VVLILAASGRLDGVGATFAGADSDGLVNRRDKDLAVADAACLGRLLDGFDGRVRA
jgi:hypothetical protein